MAATENENVQPVGRRESKKEHTRNAIADAAMLILGTQGSDALTVAAVAKAADISVRTFHNYFPSTTAALAYGFEAMITRFDTLVRQAPEDVDPLTAIELVVEKIAFEQDEMGWPTRPSDDLMVFFHNSMHQAMANPAADAFATLRATLAERETRRRHEPVHADDLEIHVVLQVSLAVVGGAQTAFMTQNPDAHPGEFIAMLHECFDIARQGFA